MQMPDTPCVAKVMGKDGRKIVKNCGKCVGHREISHAVLELLHNSKVTSIRMVKIS